MNFREIVIKIALFLDNDVMKVQKASINTLALIGFGKLSIY